MKILKFFDIQPIYGENIECPQRIALRCNMKKANECKFFSHLISLKGWNRYGEVEQSSRTLNGT